LPARGMTPRFETVSGLHALRSYPNHARRLAGPAYAAFLTIAARITSLHGRFLIDLNMRGVMRVGSGKGNHGEDSLVGTAGERDRPASDGNYLIITIALQAFDLVVTKPRYLPEPSQNGRGSNSAVFGLHVG